MRCALRFPPVIAPRLRLRCLRLRCLAHAVAALGAGLLAGCGADEPAPPPAPAPVVAAAVLPWPVSDPAGVPLLQQRVDAGAQPWLLDPAGVATSFAVAAYGWADAQVMVADGGEPGNTAVDVGGPDGRTARLLLEQPGRTGPGGIWVVTTASGP